MTDSIMSILKEMREIIDNASKPEIKGKKIVFFDFSVDKKFYDEVEYFFENDIIKNIKKWRIYDEKIIKEVLMDMIEPLEGSKILSHRFIAKRIKSLDANQLNTLIESLRDHALGMGETYFSKDHFFKPMDKKIFAKTMQEITQKPATSAKRKQAAKGILKGAKGKTFLGGPEEAVEQETPTKKKTGADPLKTQLGEIKAERARMEKAAKTNGGKETEKEGLPKKIRTDARIKGAERK